jgi:hypothetical protein
MQDKKTVGLVDAMTREYGSSARTFKSGLLWGIADTDASLREEARKVLAWEDIKDEEDELRLGDAQKRQLAENLKKLNVKELCGVRIRMSGFLAKTMLSVSLTWGSSTQVQPKTC